jgi:hypothetical protein
VIRTGVFKTPAGQYTALAVKASLARYWWLIAIPALICLCASVFDTRMIFVALITVFLIAPFIVVNACLSRLLTSEARKAVSPKRLLVTVGQNIEMMYNLYDGAAPAIDTIPWSQVSETTAHKDGWLIHLAGSPIQGIIVPASAIESVCRQQIDIYER